MNSTILQDLAELKYGFECVNANVPYLDASKVVLEEGCSVLNIELPYILKDFLEFAGNEQGGLERYNVFGTIYKAISMGVETKFAVGDVDAKTDFLKVFDMYVSYLHNVSGSILNDARLGPEVIYSELEREPTIEEKTMSRKLFDVSSNMLDDDRRKRILDGSMDIDWRLLSSKL